MPASSSASVEFTGAVVSPSECVVDILFVPIFQDEAQADDLAGLDVAMGGEWTRAVSTKEFSAKPHQLMIASVRDAAWQSRRIALVGAGKREELDAERWRRVSATAGYAARQFRAQSMGWLIRHGLVVEDAAASAADGLSAAEFDAGVYKTGEDRQSAYPSRVVVVAPGTDGDRLIAAVARGRTIGTWANFARGLTNEPGNVLTPSEFARRVSAAARQVGLAVDVLDQPRMLDLGMGLLLSIAQGSAEPPRMIVLRHDPADAPAAPVLALIGKGVTFDSGGISIKPAAGMEAMKEDMAGGAAVAAAMCALALLRTPFRLIGLIPTVENMPGGRAVKPGDVVTGASGKTVEIVNTDAEGRLILADALWYAQQLGATHLVDVATLTGHIVVGMGRTVSGLFGTPENWVDVVRAAAMRAGDRVWPLPIYEEAREQLHSEIADLVNSGERAGGAITAAAFLREFAGDLPWAHLDIAGTAWSETKKPYQPKGPTGTAIRTLIELGLTGGRARQPHTD